VRKATEIISHLRTFGRAVAVSFERLDLAEVLERSLSLMHEQLRLRQIDVFFDLRPGETFVSGNPIQLEQVFVNLFTNARDALADAERKEIHITSELRPDSVVLRVRDTGPGVPDGLEQRIFDPFFTTKDVGKGTGLGLSITYGIVRDHGGSITLESEPGRGATFVVELPLAGDEEPEEQALA